MIRTVPHFVYSILFLQHCTWYMYLQDLGIIPSLHCFTYNLKSRGNRVPFTHSTSLQGLGPPQYCQLDLYRPVWTSHLEDWKLVQWKQTFFSTTIYSSFFHLYQDYKCYSNNALPSTQDTCGLYHDKHSFTYSEGPLQMCVFSIKCDIQDFNTYYRPTLYSLLLENQESQPAVI